MIKMFASDLDGTLLNALHEADGTIRRAIRELTEAGLHVVPATGRSTPPIGEHGFTGLALDACCSNGSIVRDSRGEVLKTWTIDPQITEEMAKKAARLVGMEAAIQTLPDGYDTVCTDGMFSQGEWQLLSIARAAAANPKVLLLDEITANLDAATEARVLEALERASKQVSENCV